MRVVRCVVCWVLRLCDNYVVCVVLRCVVFYSGSHVACSALCCRVSCRFAPYAVLLRCFCHVLRVRVVVRFVLCIVLFFSFSFCGSCLRFDVLCLMVWSISSYFDIVFAC